MTEPDVSIFGVSSCSGLKLPLFRNPCTIVGFAQIMIVIGSK